MSDLFVDNIKHQSSQGSGTITLGASGETIALASGAQVSGFTGQNYPAFEATLSTSQSVSDETLTKVQFNTEVLDTNGYYDNVTNYRFTPLVAGKYFVYLNILTFAGNNSDLNGIIASIGKNGSEYRRGQFSFLSNPIRFAPAVVSCIVDMNGSTDYLEGSGLVNAADDTGSQIYSSGTDLSFFGAYRIGA